MAPYLSDTGLDSGIDRFLIREVLLVAVIFFVILTQSEISDLIRSEAGVVKQRIGHASGVGGIQASLEFEGLD